MLKPMVFGCLIPLLIALAGCGESNDDAYQRGYNVGHEDGYNSGQWDACEELGSVAPATKSRLQSCDGL